MTNDISVEMRETYREQLQLAHGRGHYDGCWKDHYPCALRRALDEVDRLAYALEVQVKVNELAYIPHRALSDSRDNATRERDRLRAALEQIKAIPVGEFRPLEDECKIWRIANDALSGNSAHQPKRPK